MTANKEPNNGTNKYEAMLNSRLHLLQHLCKKHFT